MIILILIVNSPLASPSSPASSSSSFNPDVDSFKQALDAHVERNPEFKELIDTCNSAKLVDSVAATKFVNESVSVLVSLRGNSPCTNDQKLFAKAIISLLPCWKYPGSPEGIINLEFSLMHPGIEDNFLKQWPDLAKKLLENCQRINNKSQALKKFITEESGKI
ncbi:Proline--tRNA ligase [Folsomia candida]|uniref:Proline--tRNA ligase n=1 Tax=Folsomia candida TaxID=158441 RepID=A0A226EDQ1_FOLCA|nr:Proline--tRNA ligase [Folsomia candida]